jgi:CheY-like chemotaxis protein
MITPSDLSANTVHLKKSILLMDTNPERRALRKKIMALHNVDMVSANDLDEAALVWHRDRYDLVLIDIRRDYRGALALRDEIKKDSPAQKVAFLVGSPNFVALHPAPDSYVPEETGMEWGESLRKAVRESCASLPQRNGFVEASWRITASKARNGSQKEASSAEEAVNALADPDPAEEA